MQPEVASGPMVMELAVEGILGCMCHLLAASWDVYLYLPWRSSEARSLPVFSGAFRILVGARYGQGDVRANLSIAGQFSEV